MVRNRWILIFLITATQCACLLVGVWFFGGWVEAGLAKRIELHALRSGSAVAADLAREIEHATLADGQPDLDAVRSFIDHASLMYGGLIGLVSLEDHRWRFPPRHIPPMTSSEGFPGNVRVDTTAGGGVRISEPSLDGAIAMGRTTLLGEVRLVAVRDVPVLRARLVVAQNEREIRGAARGIMRPLALFAYLAALAMILFNLLLTVAIMQRYESKMAAINANLERLVEERGAALVRTRDAIIFGLAKLAESRDDDTGEHLERIREYVQILAVELRPSHPELDDHTVRMLGITSSLHDIGKVGIPDAVLLKPGPLTGSERAVIEKHTEIGGNCLLTIKARLDDDEFLQTACEIALAHHERWDGAGYPFGLRGEEIPLAARIVALADVYDALTSERVYKKAMPHDTARAIILDGSGSHFDPRIVRAFLRREDDFRGISCSNPLSLLGGRRQTYQAAGADALEAPAPLPAPAAAPAAVEV